MSALVVKDLKKVDYLTCWRAMQAFTHRRDDATADELWLVEHPPVYTQGQAGRPEHLLAAGDIPLVQTDRGGQITYHGPGQLVAYPLLNLRRRQLGVRDLVTLIEQSVVSLLADFAVESAPRADAPGVYVQGKKIASLGLRVRKGCSYHGVAINVTMDLSPFTGINPCGYAGLAMAQLSDYTAEPVSLDLVAQRYTHHLLNLLK